MDWVSPKSQRKTWYCRGGYGPRRPPTHDRCDPDSEDEGCQLVEEENEPESPQYHQGSRSSATQAMAASSTAPWYPPSLLHRKRPCQDSQLVAIETTCFLHHALKQSCKDYRGWFLQTVALCNPARIIFLISGARRRSPLIPLQQISASASASALKQVLGTRKLLKRDFF